MKFRFLCQVYILGDTLTRMGLLMSLVYKVASENLMGKGSRQEAACSCVGSFVTSAQGLSRGHTARGCVSFSASASPALQADGTRRLGNNWMHASSRQIRQIRRTRLTRGQVYSCSSQLRVRTP